MLTTEGAAERLGISQRRVRALIAQGRIAAERIGRDWLIDGQRLHLAEHRPPGRPPGKTNQGRHNDSKVGGGHFLVGFYRHPHVLGGLPFT